LKSASQSLIAATAPVRKVLTGKLAQCVARTRVPALLSNTGLVSSRRRESMFIMPFEMAWHPQRISCHFRRTARTFTRPADHRQLWSESWSIHM